jgi:hypothetical protein
MSADILILDPIAESSNDARESYRISQLSGKVIGFIDNGKPNFHYLIDDLSELLKSKYGVAEVVRHRKRGSVPVEQSVMEEMSEQCDVVITGSGD